MLSALKGLLCSKKFLLTVAGSVVTAGLSHFNAPPEVVGIVGGLFGTNVVSQGLADFGKNQSK